MQNLRRCNKTSGFKVPKTVGIKVSERVGIKQTVFLGILARPRNLRGERMPEGYTVQGNRATETQNREIVPSERCG